MNEADIDAGWIGRSETRTDRISAGAIDRLAAVLDRDDPPCRDGDSAPPLIHWLHFLSHEAQSAIGPDGHGARGGFLPPAAGLPRRMWAGSRLTFPGTLKAGMTVERRSAITAIERKRGASGELVFVTVRHEIGEPGGAALVTDEHDIVYRGLGAPGAAKPAAQAERGAWHHALTPDPVLLFRYSALTFNGHRIHYDRDYTIKQEGYPGLVVHGPLVATLLVDLLRRQLPAARIAAFEFRAVAPLFDGNELHLNGQPPQHDGTVALWAADHEGRLAMRASARIAS